MTYSINGLKNMYQFYFVQEVLKSSDPLPLHEFFGIGEDDLIVELFEFNEVFFDLIEKHRDNMNFESSQVVDICVLGGQVFSQLLQEQVQESKDLTCKMPDIEHFKNAFTCAFKSVL